MEDIKNAVLFEHRIEGLASTRWAKKVTPFFNYVNIMPYKA